MTGAGKTHTMFGSTKRRTNSTKSVHEPGIANLAIEELFKQTEGQNRPIITVNFLEIYNEQVKDLLWTNQTENQSLAILEDPAKGVIV